MVRFLGFTFLFFLLPFALYAAWRFFKAGVRPGDERWPLIVWLRLGVVGILDDIPQDRQMRENDVLIPFAGETTLTINSPIWIDGSNKRQPQLPPKVGEHSDEVLRQAGYAEDDIRKLRGAGVIG